MKFKKMTIALLAVFISASCYADNLSLRRTTLDYQICFTPGNDCTKMVVNALEQAKRSILVQAYSFTSAPIAKALLAAHKRGVNVKVILDKSQKTARYSASTFLTNQGIPTWIDYKPAIAHSKIMVIDGETVITGSFNFTKAAQNKNAENLLILRSVELAGIYTKNWHRRLMESVEVTDYISKKTRVKNKAFAFE